MDLLATWQTVDEYRESRSVARNSTAASAAGAMRSGMTRRELLPRRYPAEPMRSPPGENSMTPESFRGVPRGQASSLANPPQDVNDYGDFDGRYPMGPNSVGGGGGNYVRSASVGAVMPGRSSTPPFGSPGSGQGLEYGGLPGAAHGGAFATFAKIERIRAEQQKRELETQQLERLRAEEERRKVENDRKMLRDAEVKARAEREMLEVVQQRMVSLLHLVVSSFLLFFPTHSK